MHTFDEKTNLKLNRLKSLSRFAKIDEITLDDIDFIKDTINSSDDESIAQALWAIGQIGIKAPFLIKEIIPLVFNALDSGNAKVRENAIFALGRSGRAKIDLVDNKITKIIDMHTDSEPKVRMSMIWACENIANANALIFKPYINIFEKLLCDPDERYVRAEAPEIFRVIGKYNPEIVKDSLPKLYSSLDDSFKVARIHARGAIRIIEKNLKKNEALSPSEQ